LLQHLAATPAAAGSADLSSRLEVLVERLPLVSDLGEVSDWPMFWASPSCAQLVGTANLLTRSGLAVSGTQAAALALWVFVASWAHPRQAVSLAASLGGWAATTAGLVGALAGALHGSAWVPADWWSALQGDDSVASADEEEEHTRGGKYALMQLGEELAGLDCRDVAPLL
jgi:ADP-ribosylglycohydrolase